MAYLLKEAVSKWGGGEYPFMGSYLIPLFCDKTLTLEVPIRMLSIKDGVSPKCRYPPPSFAKDGFKRELAVLAQIVLRSCGERIKGNSSI